jgi:dTDP-4-dehydrorhamnose reductase
MIPEEVSIMRILLLGKNGQVGWELQRALAPLGEVLALDRNNGGNLTDLAGIKQHILEYRPHVVVNAAAYTAVDKAESEHDVAVLVNHKAVEEMAAACKSINALFVHYSTDYVFSGEGEQFWSETDNAKPVNVYGHTKLQGEQAIAASGCKYLIFRTSWVYAAKGNNFAKTMLKLASSLRELSIINDQFGSPTGAELVADVTAQVVRSTLSSPNKAGLYHLVASGETTWCDYAKHIFDFAQKEGYKLKVETVKGIPTTQYPTPAKRPLNSRLNCSKLENNFGLSMPHWTLGVNRMLTEVLEKNNEK